MDMNKIHRAAAALEGLTQMEWLVLKEAVEDQFGRKMHLLEIGGEDAREISCRIERERAGMYK